MVTCHNLSVRDPGGVVSCGVVVCGVVMWWFGEQNSYTINALKKPKMDKDIIVRIF